MTEQLKQRAKKIVRLLHEDPDAIYSVQVPQGKWAKAYLNLLAKGRVLVEMLMARLVDVPRPIRRLVEEAERRSNLDAEKVQEALRIFTEGGEISDDDFDPSEPAF